MSSTLSPRIGLAQVCLAGVLWGTGGLTVQLIREIDPLHPLTISAWRLVIAAVALIGAVLVLGQAGGVLALVRRSPRRVVAVALGTAAYQGLYFAAVTHVGVTIATMVSLGLAPTLLFVVPGDQPSKRTFVDWLVLVTAITGLALVCLSAGGGSGGSAPVLGTLEAGASGVTYAATTFLGRRLSTAAAPVVVTTATTTVGAVALVPLAVLAGGPLVVDDPRAWGWLVYLGVMTMALAYLLFYAGLRVVPASSAALATLLEPVTAGLVAAAVLGERLGLAGVVGSILVLAAVAGRSRTRPAEPNGPGAGELAEPAELST
jgi:DME family drug/metabolite transporter